MSQPSDNQPGHDRPTAEPQGGTEHDQNEASIAGNDKHTAGLFDVRFFIGALLGLYGVVLVVYGLVATEDADIRASDGLNLNLVAGLGMVVVSAVFFAWQKLRPTVVDESAAPKD